MFAGIIKGTGRIAAVEEKGGDRRLTVDLGSTDLGVLEVGASVAVSGVCLTALAPVPDRAGGRLFVADVSRETLAVTTLQDAAVGGRVNLEASLKLGDPVDGHLVYGHVDAVATVREVTEEGRSWRIGIDVPAALGRYIAAKGSVAVDGVSLTVNRVAAASFEVNVIPHTRAVTIIDGYAPGTTVNIEVDMMARYAERLTTGGFGAGDNPGITIETLRQHGFTGDD